jgi:signal transduction histidine kinase
MVRKKIQTITRFDLFSTHIIPATIVFIMMMILIGFSWRTATRGIIEEQNEEVEVRATFVKSNIHERIALYENTLRAAAGLFTSSSFVSRDEWAKYVELLEIDKRLPGMIGIGYVDILSRDQIPAYESRIRSEGLPNFTVNPVEPVRDFYTSITYISPLTERNLQVLGGDMYTEEVRRAAMERARETGAGSMTDTVSILQDNLERKNGVVLYFPIYTKNADLSTPEKRKAAISGYVYSPISPENIFNPIFDDQDTDFNFEIYDADSESESSFLYARNPDKDPTDYDWVAEETLVLSDQSWRVKYGVRDSIVTESIRNRPQSIAYGGTIFSIVVAAIVYLLLQRRTRVISDKQERKIERAKDNLLSLASHQLRTPATGVKQYLGMVLEGFTGDIKPEQHEVLSRAYESNERQLRIINEFLYLARADANRVVISPQKFDVLKLVKDALDDMRPDIEDAGHKIRLTARAKTVPVYADVHSVRMIVENLLSNAIKYTPDKGKITVTIKREGTECLIQVEDTGVGIDRKDFSKLFKQFSRIPNDLTKQTTGSGIGLYLSKYLARENGGDIDVRSLKNKGSTFSLYLPTKNVKKHTVKSKH